MPCRSAVAAIPRAALDVDRIGEEGNVFAVSQKIHAGTPEPTGIVEKYETGQRYHRGTRRRMPGGRASIVASSADLAVGRRPVYLMTMRGLIPLQVGSYSDC